VTTERASLQVGEDMQLQRRTWAIERVAWGISILLVLLGLGGLFAVGPLSSAVVSDEAGLVHLGYERFSRVSAPSLLHIELDQDAVHSGPVTIELSRPFVEAIQIERIQPAPSRELIGMEGGLAFEFAAIEPGQQALIQLFIKPAAMGLVEGSIALRGQSPIRFTQLVYP
jgi:hypothetical protein